MKHSKKWRAFDQQRNVIIRWANFEVTQQYDKYSSIW